MRLLGLASNAAGGKDLMASLLIRQLSFKNIKAKRFSLGDKLKLELYDFFLKQLNIDIINCSREDKNLVRDILVSYANVRRQKTEGKYFTSLLQLDIDRAFFLDPELKLVIVPDIRFAEFDGTDEYNWLKNQGGKLVFIDLFNIKDGKKIYNPPPNNTEARNNPILKQKADIKIEWENCDNNPQLIGQKLIPVANSVVSEIVDFINVPAVS